MTATIIVMLYFLVGFAIWHKPMQEAIEEQGATPMAVLIMMMVILVAWPYFVARVAYLLTRDALRKERV
jgi:divalent metal cation (Fe/Co/Zn/Cd) transporter